MEQLITELQDIKDELQVTVREAQERSVTASLEKLEERAAKISLAWSGSWAGYQAHVYYRDLRPPPRGVYFDRALGLDRMSQLQPMWIEHSREEVAIKIREGVNQKSIDKIVETLKRCSELFENHKYHIVSIIRSLRQETGDTFLDELVTMTNELSEYTPSQHTRPPSHHLVSDAVAIHQGLWEPPHIETLKVIEIFRFSVTRLQDLIRIVEQALAHVSRRKPTRGTTWMAEKRVFIGHGHSLDWMVLEKFLKEHLNLKVEEFNRVPTGGVSTKERLEQMLNSSCFAFLVLTAEDVTVAENGESGGNMQARMNVIHEAGLFQGRLGFEHAIIVLENGCTEFSNIHGVGQIRFDKGKLSAVYEEIRRHLEKQEIL